MMPAKKTRPRLSKRLRRDLERTIRLIMNDCADDATHILRGLLGYYPGADGKRYRTFLEMDAADGKSADVGF